MAQARSVCFECRQMGQEVSQCSFPDCGRKVRVKKVQLCSGHWRQSRKGRPLTTLAFRSPIGKRSECLVDRCRRPASARGRCKIHYDAKRKEWGLSRGDPVKNSLKFHYGLTIEQYERAIEKQNGLCAICKKICACGKRLAVDHNHETGKLRGLLCMRCNTAIGLLEEDTERFSSAVTYLKAA